jgi:FixJ family two-component response regulator
VPERPRRIVIVEDDRSMRNAMHRLLRAAGYASVGFASAEALLETGTVEDAGCLILDVGLPGLSGPELRARLVAAGAATSVVFITGRTESRPEDAARRNNAVAYLLKPFDAQQLLDAVARALAA